MSQRLLTAVVLVLSILCVGLTVFAWQSHLRNQVMQQELLARLTELASRPSTPVYAPAPSPSPAEWNRLTAKCVYDKPGGEPASGITVTVHGQTDSTKAIPPMEETTRQDGTADFGLVLFGSYRVSLKTPGGLISGHDASVRPGQDCDLEVVCPRPGEVAKVRLTVDAPLVTENKLWIVGTLELTPTVSVKVPTWMSYEPYSLPFVIRPDGLLTSGDDVAASLTTPTARKSSEGTTDSDTPASRLVKRAMYSAEFARSLDWSEEIDIPPGGYTTRFITAGVSEPSDPTGSTMLWGFDLPGFVGADGKVDMTRLMSRGIGDCQFALGETTRVELELPQTELDFLKLAAQVPLGMELVPVSLPRSYDEALPSDREGSNRWKSFDLLGVAPPPDLDSGGYMGLAESEAADPKEDIVVAQVQGVGTPLDKTKFSTRVSYLFLYPHERAYLSQTLVRPFRSRTEDRVASLDGNRHRTWYLRPNREPVRTDLDRLDEKLRAAAPDPKTVPRRIATLSFLQLEAEGGGD